MSKKSVFCLAHDEAQACNIVGELQNAGFSNNDISVLLPDKSSTREFLMRRGQKPRKERQPARGREESSAEPWAGSRELVLSRFPGLDPSLLPDRLWRH